MYSGVFIYQLGGYTYVLDGFWIYAGCYSESCKELGAILYGSILQDSF